MRLAVSYDTYVHFPAFHALKVWCLAVMASSASLFHHQDSCRHRWSCALTPYFVCNKPVLSFDQISSEVVAVSVNTMEDFLELAARLRISELPYFQTRRAWVAQGRF